jgi:hypothetical protein
MASVEVFVDDAVRGNFPNVCAKTGRPAGGVLRIEDSRGGIGLAWVLLLFGPIGWLVLLAVVALARRETLVVRLPYSDEGLREERRKAHVVWQSLVVGALCVVAAALELEPLPISVWIVATLVAAAVFVVACTVMLVTRVGVRLDASHRWVTLSRVHPDFVAAVQAMYRDRRDAPTPLLS